MGRQKKGNANAQRNNNAKAQGKKNDASELETYAEYEVKKMRND
ncbi:hypothetical protein SAMN05421736_13221 [Evansella caseinilytica]|uniref:Uncharacterized protein n=1 Tax=Evansella caseinilytica TaxID=1503961 RepID=A0A1H3V2D7_9BACI|nr:hypothetical protein [Evansella caseinilytica]SDZ68195.1 hypothetical protein SAMN05421736_13221 [Evansella caseinilytica]